MSNFEQRHATTSNNMQRGVETDATCNIQQCWEFLANNVASVCTGLKTPNVLQNSSLLFSITHSSSFSVIHVSLNIKYNVEKDTTLLLFFFFLKVRACDFFSKLFYIGMPVVRTDGRAVGRSEYGHVITKFSRIGSLPHFFTLGAPLASRAREPL